MSESRFEWDDFQTPALKAWVKKTLADQKLIQDEMVKFSGSITADQYEGLLKVIEIINKEIMVFDGKAEKKYRAEATRLIGERTNLEKQIAGASETNKAELESKLKTLNAEIIEIAKENARRNQVVAEITADYSGIKAQLKKERTAVKAAEQKTITSLLDDLDDYSAARNKKYKAADNINRASVNALGVFGVKKDPDYRKRREYIQELKDALTEFSKKGDDDSKQSLREKIIEGEQFKPRKEVEGGESSLETVLNRIAKQLDLDVTVKYKK